MEERRACHPIVRQIINRDCHVSMTNRAVVKYVISKLKQKHKTFKTIPKEDRRRFIEDCIYIHTENRSLYRYVMGPSH